MTTLREPQNDALVAKARAYLSTRATLPVSRRTQPTLLDTVADTRSNADAG
ncbi:hypothetical protein WCLP8_1360001 [uncultured Gammaproteobacteria bacterium]